MEKLAYLQNKWQAENRIAEEGRRAAIRYEHKLAERREECKAYVLMALLVVVVVVGCCII
jgi:hypothetical protein